MVEVEEDKREVIGDREEEVEKGKRRRRKRKIRSKKKYIEMDIQRGNGRRRV